MRIAFYPNARVRSVVLLITTGAFLVLGILLLRGRFPLETESAAPPYTPLPFDIASPSPSLPTAPGPAPAIKDPDLHIRHLIQTRLFSEALAFAEAAFASDTDMRHDRVVAILAAWVRARPADAPSLAIRLHRHDTTPSAFPDFYRAWAKATPVLLADHALALPAGSPHRALALTAALDLWTINDPAGASDWIVRLSDPSEFDQAAALLLERTDGLQRSTATALSWAENLADPALRLRALAHVLREWAGHDPSAARRYPATLSSLAADERATLLAALGPDPADS